MFTHEDHISSSNVVTDSSGNQAALLEYDPYGSTVTHTGTVDPKHKYTGQESDDSTRLYYYGARYYDPQIGRFVSADRTVQHPFDPQDMNRYSYARNNPIKFYDPTGLGWFKKLIAAIIGITVGTVVTIVTGNLVLGFSAGVAAYRASEAYLNGASVRGTATAGVNGFGEGLAIINDPTKVGSLIGPPTTSHVTAEGKDGLKYLLRSFGLDSFSANIITNQISTSLTEDGQNSNKSQSTNSQSISNDEAIRRDEQGLQEDRIFEDLIIVFFGGMAKFGVNIFKKETATVLTNRAAGNAFRDEIAEALRMEGRIVETEVVKKTGFGTRVIDIQVRDRNGSILGGIETKFGNARYGPSQRAKDKWLEIVEGYHVNVVRNK